MTAGFSMVTALGGGGRGPGRGLPNGLLEDIVEIPRFVSAVVRVIGA